MRVVDLKGAGVRDFLRYLLANNVDKLAMPQGKALYSCMLENGGDNLIVYFMNEGWFRVVNAGTADKDIAWMKRRAPGHRVVHHRPPRTGNDRGAGPNARAKVWEALPAAGN